MGGEGLALLWEAWEENPRDADTAWPGESSGLGVGDEYGETSPPSCLRSPPVLLWRSGTSRSQVFVLRVTR